MFNNDNIKAILEEIADIRKEVLEDEPKKDDEDKPEPEGEEEPGEDEEPGGEESDEEGEEEEKGGSEEKKEDKKQRETSLSIVEEFISKLPHDDPRRTLVIIARQSADNLARSLKGFEQGVKTESDDDKKAFDQIREWHSSAQKISQGLSGFSRIAGFVPTEG